jgi:Secretion system C-terminal sorting domain
MKKLLIIKLLLFCSILSFAETTKHDSYAEKSYTASKKIKNHVKSSISGEFKTRNVDPGPNDVINMYLEYRTIGPTGYNLYYTYGFSPLPNASDYCIYLRRKNSQTWVRYDRNSNVSILDNDNGQLTLYVSRFGPVLNYKLFIVPIINGVETGRSNIVDYAEQVVDNKTVVAPTLSNNGNGQVTINYKNFDDSKDVIGYFIADKVNKIILFDPHTPGVVNNSAVIKNLQAGKSYSFAIIAYDKNGNISVPYPPIQLIYFNVDAKTKQIEQIDSIETMSVKDPTNITIYPNPVSGDIMNITAVKNNSLYSIYDNSGNEVSKGNVSDGTINVSRLIKGNYILQVQVDNQTIVKQFIRQ